MQQRDRLPTGEDEPAEEVIVAASMFSRFRRSRDAANVSSGSAVDAGPAPIADLGDSDFFDSLDGHATIVDFWAPWCGPCRMLTPVVEELASDYEGRATVAKLNVDEAAGVAQRYNVGSIPTVLVFKGGEVVWSFTGVAEKAKFAEVLDQHLG